MSFTPLILSIMYFMENSKTNFTILILVAIAFVGVQGLYQYSKRPTVKISMQDQTVNIDDQVIKIIDVGQHRMISSLLWSETLLRSDIDHYSQGDFKNWMFLRMKTITSLDPYFYEAYLNGGVYLSIIKDDDLGAEYIYDRGLKYYPNDYYLNLNASFHYYFELGKVQKSIDALESITRIPDKETPRFVSELLAKMKSLQGNKSDALIIISKLYNNSPPETPIRKKYRTILYSLKAEIDLTCLNKSKSKSNNCQRTDLDGAAYELQTNGKWKASKKWRPYKVKSPSKPEEPKKKK